AGAPVPGLRRALVPALVGVPARLRALGRRLGGPLLGRLTDACRDRGVVLPGGEGGGVVLPVGVGGVGIHRRVLRRVGGAGLGQHGGGVRAGGGGLLRGQRRRRLGLHGRGPVRGGGGGRVGHGVLRDVVGGAGRGGSVGSGGRAVRPVGRPGTGPGGGGRTTEIGRASCMERDG